MMTGPLTVLFLSTGNAARSLLAEAIMRHRGGVRFIARSAGFRPLPAPHPHTLALLAANGIRTDGLHAKGWDEFLAAARVFPIHVLVTLSEEARERCPAWPAPFDPYGWADDLGRGKTDKADASRTPRGPVRVHWAVDDPLSADQQDVRDWKFRKCFATLETRIAALIKSRAAQSAGELLMQLKAIGMVV